MLSRMAVGPALLAGLAAAAHGDTRTAAQPPSLTLMTYNVNYADRGRGETMAAIAERDPDVVLLQEVNASWVPVLRKQFAAVYPHMVFHPHARAAGGLAVLSKLPISEDEVLAPAAGWFPAQRIKLDTALGPLDVLHVHLRPAILDGSWVKGYFATPPIRRREIETYWGQLPRPPAIVAGDFNEEPARGVEEFLAGNGMTRVATTGDVRTWRWVGGGGLSLALDIDHVVIRAGLAATGATVIDKGRSDHRPLVVTLTAADGRAQSTGTSSK